MTKMMLSQFIWIVNCFISYHIASTIRDSQELSKKICAILDTRSCPGKEF